MAQPTYNIIICKHEPASMQELAAASTILIPFVENLAHDLGDYMVGNWVLERKDSGDFISSLIDGRLFDQARKLAQLPADYKKAFILEGQLSYKILKIRHLTQEHINGAINSLLLDYGIPMFRTSSKNKTIALLEKLVDREKNPFDILTVIRHKGIGKMTLDQKAAFVIQGFDGLGKVKAEELLKETKTLWNALCSMHCSGVIGEIDAEFENGGIIYSKILKGKTLKKIAQLLDHSYGSDS